MNALAGIATVQAPDLEPEPVEVCGYHACLSPGEYPCARDAVWRCGRDHEAHILETGCTDCDQLYRD